MDPRDAEAVGDVFAESDASELPRLVGVSRRTLFSFHDLYFHLVEADADITPNLRRVHDHALFRDVSAKLEKFVAPYHPDWAEPKDAMASPFYVWTAERGRVR